MASSKKRIKSKLVAENSIEFPQLSSNTVPVLDADKNIISSVVTSSELDNLSGITSSVQDQLDSNNDAITLHVNNSSNPHAVTKSQVGLGNVDNTSDANKPISTATQTALNLKYDASNPANFVNAAGAAAAAPVQSVSGKVGVVSLDKSDVGLGNVDNTSDANKPISTATQSALNGKQDSLGFTPENVANKSTDATLAENSDTLYPSQKAIRTYVDNSISSASIPDATTTVKGKIKLAGDLSGTADAPTVPELANKEPTIVAGTTSQYYRGDKTFQTLDKSAVGLANVDNTSDASKPVSTATQTALNLKYDASNPSNYVDAAGASAAAPVQSVAGKIGAVTLLKSDVGLGNVDNTSDADKPISTATQTALNGKIDSSREGQPSGIATLDVAGKVPASQLPSYVDDVIEVANFASLPVTGETGKIYVTLDTNVCYRWSGTVYVQITSGAVSSVNGQTGAVVLTKSDVGLGNVDNTSDADKPISTATATALSGKEPTITAGSTSQYYRGDKTFQTLNLGAIDQSSATTGQVPVWNGTSWVPAVPSGTSTWGGITGTLSNQTDLQNALNAKFDDPTGTTDQYIRGDGSLATFPTSINQANSLVTTVFNKSGALIPKFSVVYISGGQGDLPTISLAQANNEANSSQTYGVVYADIANMQSGQVIVAGALTGVNTDQFNPTAPSGDVNGVALYLSPTIAGAVTTVKPSAPNHMVYVATIVRTHQTQGVIEVRIQNGFELQELHNVALSSPPSNNQVLKYEASTSLWKNKYIGSPGDIEETNFSLANNQSSAANVTGFVFSNSVVRGFSALVTVEIDATADLFEQFTLNGIQKNSQWDMSIESTGDDSGILFSINSSGQIQYTSSNKAGFISGLIKFRAITTSI